MLAASDLLAPGRQLRGHPAENVLRGEVKHNLVVRDLVMIDGDGRVLAAARGQTHGWACR